MKPFLEVRSNNGRRNTCLFLPVIRDPKHEGSSTTLTQQIYFSFHWSCSLLRHNIVSFTSLEEAAQIRKKEKKLKQLSYLEHPTVQTIINKIKLTFLLFKQYASCHHRKHYFKNVAKEDKIVTCCSGLRNISALFYNSI